MIANRSGTCFAQESLRTNALMVSSWLKGFRQSLKVPSIYQALALHNTSSCCCMGGEDKVTTATYLISPRRKFSGMCSGWNSNSKPTESASLNRCRRWLAALARFTGFGKLGQGSSVYSSISTSLTTADSGLNKFATASFFCPFSNPGC